MARKYTFHDGKTIEATFAQLKQLLVENQQYLKNYEEMFEDLDDATHVARGNGFCATQYSEEFIEEQIAKYKTRLADIKKWLSSPAALKSALRTEIRSLKKQQDAQTLAEQSKAICAKVLQNPAVKKAQVIMLYSALPDEVQTLELIENLKNTKKVILPTVVGDDIIPVALDESTTFATGDFDITEPQGKPYEGRIDVVIIPGMAFDHNRNRLGRGKGYYDRFLEQHSESRLIGICYDFQYVSKIPTEATDITMDEVIH